MGLVSTLSAIPTGLFTAYLYERGEQTVWAPFLMHAGNYAIAFMFTFPPQIQPVAASFYLLISTAWSLILLFWAYRGGYGRVGVMTPASTPNR